MDKSALFYHEYLTHRQASRRGLLRGLLSASRKTLVPIAAYPPGPARPPGALPENIFLSRCDQCQGCVECCQPGVLVRDDDGYPRLNIEYAACTACGACIDVCTGEALLAQTRFDTGLRPVLNAAACINPRSRCGLCAAVCPTQALTIGQGNGLPSVDEQRCNGCGECLIQCADRAISLESPSPVRT
ncbi:ferredoxin-type protein NapF [Acerihabitans sp. TG2]|uniref:ferredoxin-type protein NapF n=1 Tax=Acerihabitans sp. TG2 TaxID=3096008 RepID=UPI002B230B42|nr:ferredoxin-type protein NapF [Acerihabitans sp. TG2]MEA9392115.1 ferredoxin-type protein NapF [Acerihabitans sp. TG2]